MTRRVRVGVFAGGRSAEHEVSVSSAETVIRAIDRDRFEPYLVYIDREGRWHLPEGPAALDDRPLAELVGTRTPAQLTTRDGGEPAAREVADAGALQPRAALRSLAEAIDVAFLAMHGPFGEDGTLQGFLELAGIPYTGARVLASAVAMDKVVFKDLMRGHGLPVCRYLWFSRGRWTADPPAVLREIAAELGRRSVVKPARLGSSVGMTLVHAPEELPAALDEAFRHDSKAIVEEYVAGARELECGVLGADDAIAFEPGEIVSHNEFYDYEAKYVPGLAEVVPRAEIDPRLSERLRELSLAAYRAVDCSGMARVDFLVPDGGVFISEMNTIPGFTATSMFPKQAELAGLTLPRLIQRLIELALERGASRPDEGR
ncbi:MAG: D-alanine--D-alanine ligase family protein [Candidatus Limnocylindria bacterium]